MKFLDFIKHKITGEVIKNTLGGALPSESNSMYVHCDPRIYFNKLLNQSHGPLFKKQPSKKSPILAFSSICGD